MSKNKNSLENIEVSLIKAMLQSKKYKNHQDVLAYFTRPSRSINHARITEIAETLTDGKISKAAQKYKDHPAASKRDLDKFLREWPNTTQRLEQDEPLVKAREALIFSVQAFNNPAAYFKSEVFIVIACIGWTYLMHQYYKSKGIDYVYRDEHGNPQKTDQGADKYLDLAKCLSMKECPLDAATKANLEYLIGIRHEIEHRLTKRIDHHISAKLQACCLNFNRYIKELFSPEYGLDKELSLALQFATIDADQFSVLKEYTDLPAHIRSFNAGFEDKLKKDTYNDPRYSYRVALVHKKTNNKNTADAVVEFVIAGSEQEKEINTVIRETEKSKLLFKHIKSAVHDLGFIKFNNYHHTQLVRSLDAKKTNKGFGADVAGTWYWYEGWRDEVVKHVKANSNKYLPEAA